VLVTTVIEISKGSHAKFEWKNGGFKLSRFTQRPYPAAYGFIPGTLSEDGDPLDVLVLSSGPLSIADALKTRPIAVLRMVDHGYRDNKILAVVPDDPSFAALHDLPDVPGPFLVHVITFYTEMGKTLHGWGGRAEAEGVIRSLAT